MSDSSNMKRLDKPDLFYGDRKETRVWLLRMELHFKYHEEDMDDSDKPAYAACYMRGDAFEWVKPYVEE
ncbi:hypothetical protein BU24DRAFT_351364, partial [Aaosphaeria arxii CBS 175.79]